MWDIPTLLELGEVLQSSVLKTYSKIHFHEYNQKLILYTNLSYHYCVREMVCPSPNGHSYDACLSKVCSLVENYISHLLTICPEHMPSIMLGLSHLSSFITHHERDGIIHFFSDDDTQAHCKEQARVHTAINHTQKGA